MTAKLELRQVWKSFGERDVLRAIDLVVEEHEVVCLIGSSGSGKSTLLRCANLLEPIDDGAVLLDGDDISAPGLDDDALRRRIGIVFQAFNLFPHLDVLRNVTLGPRRALRLDNAEAVERADALLTRFGLADKRGAYPDQLSGGQQQRVAIVRALAMDPELVLLDEITSALDPELVGEVQDVVAELKASGMTMIIATHDLAFARQIADRVCFLHEGRIHEQGPPATLLTAPAEERTRQFLRRVTR